MTTVPINSCDTPSGGSFAGDPFCTRGLREALERLERQIGRIGDIATERDVPPPPINSPCASESPSESSVAEPATHISQANQLAQPTAIDSELQARHEAELRGIRAALMAEIDQANARRTAAEQRADSLQKQVEAAIARGDDLASQIAALQESLRQREAVPPVENPAMHRQVSALQAELRLLRKERDQLMSRLHREESRLQQAGITIEWAEPAAKPKPAKPRRRSS